MPVGLHAGAEHGAGRSHLRDAQGDTGISRGAVGGRARPDVRRAGSIRTCAGGLSGRSPGLDSPPRRLELTPAAVARARAHGDLSGLPVDDHCSIGQLTIQGIPNWSTHMPKPLVKKVFPNGMLTLPPSARALNLRSASDAMNTSPSIDILACMIFFFHSGGVGISSGPPS